MGDRQGTPGPDRERLEELIGRLPEREQYTIRHRFGFVGGGPCRLEDVSMALGVTRERVRRIEIDAMLELRRMMDEGPGQEGVPSPRPNLPVAPASAMEPGGATPEERLRAALLR